MTDIDDATKPGSEPDNQGVSSPDPAEGAPDVPDGGKDSPGQ